MDQTAIVLAGHSHQTLARAMAHHLGLPFMGCQVTRFSGQEIRLQLNTNLARRACVIVACLGNFANDRIMEVALMVDVVMRAGATSITLVLPYLAYGRQHPPLRQIHTAHPAPHTPTQKALWQSSSLEVLAKFLGVLPIDHILTLELHHAPSTQLFSGRLVNLSPTPLFAQALQPLVTAQGIRQPWCVVAPDLGSRGRAGALAQALTLPLVYLNKTRSPVTGCHSRIDQGDVLGKTCLLVDDILDSGQTLAASARTLRAQGAKQVYACITHCLGTPLTTPKDNHPKALQKLGIDRLWTTQSLCPATSHTFDPSANLTPHPRTPIQILALDQLLSHSVASILGGGAHTAPERQKEHVPTSFAVALPGTASVG